MNEQNLESMQTHIKQIDGVSPRIGSQKSVVQTSTDNKLLESNDVRFS